MQPTKEQVEKFNKTYELTEEIHNRVDVYAMDTTDILDFEDFAELDSEHSHTIEEYACSEYAILKRDSGDFVKIVDDVPELFEFIASL